MNQKNILTYLLLTTTIVFCLINQPVQAGYYQSSTITMVNAANYGARLLGHDAKQSQVIKYYVQLYSDYSSTDLKLNAFSYADNSLVLTQVAVNHTQWYAGTSVVYAISNVWESSFYLAYQKSINSLGLRYCYFQYDSNQVITSFSVSSEYVWTTSAPIYNVGIDLYYVVSTNKLWIATIVQTSVLNAQIYQGVNGNIIKTTTIELDFTQLWNVQLAISEANVYAWVWGYSLTASSGKLYNADTGVYITTPSSGLQKRSSTLSLSNGTIVIVCWNSDDYYIKSFSLSPGNTSFTETTAFYVNTLNDLSAFEMPNNNFGVFFVDANGLNAAYYAKRTVYLPPPGGSYDVFEWSAIMQIYNNPWNTYGQDHVSADRSTDILSYPGRPSVWTNIAGDILPYGGGGYSLIPYGFLQSVDLYTINGLSVTTSMVTISSTRVSTQVSYSTLWQSTTTAITTNTNTMSAIQTPTFFSGLIILFIFLLVPGAALGYFGGLIGFVTGLTIGAGLAFAFGQLPLWLLIVAGFIDLCIILLYRE